MKCAKILAPLLGMFVGSIAFADQIPGSKTVVAGWYIGAYERSDATFSHCAMSATYRSGITMLFSVSSNYSWRVGWAKDSWTFAKQQTVPIAIYVDGTGPYNLSATATSSNLAFAELPGRAALFDVMRKGYRMTVHAAGNSYAFNLDGTYAALTEILDCVGRYTRAANSPQQPPVPTPPIASPPKIATPKNEVTAEQKLEATKVVANILAQGEMTGFRLLTAKEIAEINTDYTRSAHVVWRAEGVVGTLRILPTKDVSLSSANAGIIGDDAKVCKGRFASGSTPDDKSPKVLRLFTACEENGKTLEIHYTLVPVGDGLHYLFSTLGFSDKEATTGKVAKVETILRQAVYKVIKE